MTFLTKFRISRIKNITEVNFKTCLCCADFILMSDFLLIYRFLPLKISLRSLSFGLKTKNVFGRFYIIQFRNGIHKKGVLCIK